MSRPKKWKKVCCLPDISKFGPLNMCESENNQLVMTVEEYETIRLIDYEGLKQDECAERMNVARTTVQGIYDDARKKIADALVNGKMLIIKGGNYMLCEGNENFCGKKGCHRHRCGGSFEFD